MTTSNSVFVAKSLLEALISLESESEDQFWREPTPYLIQPKRNVARSR